MELGTLRIAVEQMDREIAMLPVASALRTAWSRLVGTLALGPPRATRNCPDCGNLGMRDATLCGYCWKKLVPFQG
jgi:hypothetical protein